MRVCEICRDSNLEFIHRQNFLFPGQADALHYDVVACSGCGFCYASDIPDQSILNKFYQAAEHHIHPELPEGLARIHADFFQFVRANASLEGSARILDVGSGMGHFLNRFKEAGFSCLEGIEPSPAAAELARKVYGVNVHSTNIDDFIVRESFDFVSLCGVLEHIADLGRSIDRVSSMVREGGYLFIAVPDASSFGKATPTEPFLEFALEHINFFSASSLDNLLKVFGFEKVSVISQHNDFYNNDYLLALYRRVSVSSGVVVRDCETLSSLRSYVSLSRQILRYVEVIADELVQSQEPLVIWGAGGLTSRLLCDTRLSETNICAFIDRNKGLHGKKLLNVPIKGPDSIGCYQGSTVFIASTTYAAEIRDTLLRQYGWSGRIIGLSAGGKV